MRSTRSGAPPYAGASRPWALRPVCLGALVWALATPGSALAQMSLILEEESCRPGLIEHTLNGWLVSATRAEFDSEYAAIAFDELLAMVAIVRDVAQNFCV
jgi:hypothetical protein